MKIRTLLLTLFVGCLCCICGCAKQIYPVITQYNGLERILEKNFTIGQINQVNVGDIVVKVKDYVVIKSSSDSMEPTNDFIIMHKNGHVILNGKKSTPIKIVGTVEDQGVKYRLLQCKDYRFLIPINMDGEYLGGIAVRILGGFAPENDIQIWGKSNKILVPSYTKFRQTNQQEIDTSARFINFELLYTGMTKESINFLYREYTLSDMARPAFYQNLTYPPNVKSIRFRSLKIDLIKVDAQLLKYVVIKE